VIQLVESVLVMPVPMLQSITTSRNAHARECSSGLVVISNSNL
jgi:hypothetical protein